MGCAGGVWKTTDGGTYWENISDGYFETSAVGALEVARADPNVIYAGMGESCTAVPRQHWTSRADGVYKSTDGGRSWANVGLSDTRHIARLRTHPQDADLVYAAVLGRLESPHPRRGVFRSKDGGESWERVLFRGARAGANDLWIDPSNPRVLYAALWDAGRSYWNSYSGGAYTSLYRTADGGDSWTEIGRGRGMPGGVKGRIGVAGSPARAGRVWALFDAGGAPGTAALADRADETENRGGLFRSDDYGDSWERVSGDPQLTVRAHYYNHIFAHPTDADTVYVLNQPFFESIDGGRTFFTVETPHYDHHDLWIDPNDPNRMIDGNDGGACVSFDGGGSWSSIYNQPTGEFYHLTTDDEFPYRLYATQQENCAISVRSRSSRGAIAWSECYSVGSAESGHIAVRQDAPNVVYSGALGSTPAAGPAMLRYDHATGQARAVTVWPDLTGFTVEDRKRRFEWDNPITMSPHDPNVLYSAANVMFRSTDDGASWQVISPDLTRADLADREEFDAETNIAPFERCAISRLAESPIARGTLWSGSNDGLVHLSADGGGAGRNVTPADLPEWTPIFGVEPSRHDPAVAYLAASRYQHGDYRPYLFGTNDYGESWRRIDAGIPRGDYTRVIREDPERRGMLYAGSEGGVYVSFDDGASWHSLRLDMPPVPIHDMVVKGDDLVVATHGRALWILGGLGVLRQFDDAAAESRAHLFAPSPAYRVLTEPYGYWERQSGAAKLYQLGLGIPATYRIIEDELGARETVPIDAGQNPPYGVVVSFHLKEHPPGEIALEFFDSEGNLLRKFSSERGAPRLPVRAGMNRFVWDTQLEPARRVEGESRSGRPPFTPSAPAGAYRARLSVGGDALETWFEIRKDPRVSVSDEDSAAQHETLIAIRDKVSEAADAVNQIRAIRERMDTWARLSAGVAGRETLLAAIERASASLSAIEDDLLIGGGSAPTRGAFYERGLRPRLAALADTVGMGDGRPTRQAMQVYAEISAQIDERIERLRRVVETDVEAVSGVIAELDLTPMGGGFG